MLQGELNAPGTFMRIVSDLFGGYLGQLMWVYINDILIYLNTKLEHLKHITRVSDKLKQG